MESSVGILAFGSLIANPGWEIEEAIVGRKTGVLTPFSVEFARESGKHSGAPTLVPVTVGGSPVKAHILMLNISEQDAKDRLWRRDQIFSFVNSSDRLLDALVLSIHR